MLFINQSMFTGKLHIPNLEEKCVKDFEVLKVLAKAERSGLELALGTCLFEELMEQLKVKTENGKSYFGLKDGAEEKWQWLINGRSYKDTDLDVTSYNRLYEGCGCSAPKRCERHIWEGFVVTTPAIINGEALEFEESFLADYAYYIWSFYNLSRTTGVGEQEPQAKNSVTVPNKMKRIDAYNSFWAKVQRCSAGGRVGLHGFLHEHAELFPNWTAQYFEPMNYTD